MFPGFFICGSAGDIPARPEMFLLLYRAEGFRSLYYETK